MGAEAIVSTATALEIISPKSPREILKTTDVATEREDELRELCNEADAKAKQLLGEYHALQVRISGELFPVLLRIKTLLPYGEWETWYEAFCKRHHITTSLRTVQRAFAALTSPDRLLTTRKAPARRTAAAGADTSAVRQARANLAEAKEKLGASAEAGHEPSRAILAQYEAELSEAEAASSRRVPHADMLKGIAAIAESNPDLSDEELAVKLAVAPITVTQAKMRHLEWRKLDEARDAGLPVYSLTFEQRLHDMRLLLDYDRTQLIEDGIVGQTMHGLALLGHYFPHMWAVRCGGKKSPLDTFADDERLQSAMARYERYGQLNSESDLRKALKTASGSQSVSNFRPTAAAALYDRFMPDGGGVTWDMCAGYGGRLLGAIVSDRVRKYIGTDPASKTFESLTAMAKELVPMAELFDGKNVGPTEVELHKIGSENFVPDRGSIQLAFTSPPYFAAEEYSSEPTQSYIKFPTREAWLDGFLSATLSNAHHGLAASGMLVVNLANVASYADLTDDFLMLARRCGFRHIETLRLALSAMPGTRAGAMFKYEPVFIFEKV